MADLKLSHVVKRFGAVSAVQDLSFHVPAGQRLVILGPSGCGKTTTLRMIAGLEKPDSGIIRLGELELGSIAPARRDIAMVFQDAALYPHLNVRENLAFALRSQRLAAPQIKARIDEAATAFELAELLARYPETLSGGQRSRVAFARAIAKRPTLLLLDEPLSGLDPPLRWQLQQQWLRWHEQVPTTTLHVTHDQQEAMLMGDLVAVMRSGKLEQFGAPQQLYQRPANRFVASFIGSPGMNFARGPLAAGQISLGSLAIAPPIQCSDVRGAIDVGVRPEAIQLVSQSAPPPANGPQMTIAGTVRSRRVTGAQWLVAVAWADYLWWVNCRDADRFQIGDSVLMLVDYEDLHCFPSPEVA